jgi:cell division transport system permease protein
MQSIKRVIIQGSYSFYRNMTVSISSIFILVITLSIVTSIILTKAVFLNTLEEVKSKVDISLYLQKETNEESELAIKEKLQTLQAVKEVIFISKEDTLIKFKEDHKNNAETLEALNEIVSNPFGSSFVITAKNTNDYAAIVDTINASDFLGKYSDSVDRINYTDIKYSIDRINNLIKWSTEIGYILTIIFISISIMIIYNTTRLAIFNFKDEIHIMKLVGASDTFIKGPFLIEASIYGIIASIFTSIAFIPISEYITGKTVSYLDGFSLYEYYMSDFLNIALILLCSSIVVSTTSSFLAVRKHLRG